MKKAFLIVLSVILSLVIILPGATAVMADSEEEIKVEPAVRAALLIRNPSTAEVGQPVTITVFGRYNYQPVAGAEVYALKTDNIASTADRKNYTPTTADYVALLDDELISLGETNQEGNITPTFTDTNRYMLVAFKTGYQPGFSRITITFSAKKRLHIRVPGSAIVGHSFNMTVIERLSQEPVANAAIYARKIGEIGLPKPKFPPVSNNVTGVVKSTKVKPAKVETVTIAQETQNAEELQKNGISLGYTNDKGELASTVNETGHYALAAIKEDYAPGFARINIVPADRKVLRIKAPEKAEVGESVTITVFERGSHQPVANVNVYALRVADVFTARPAEKPTTLIMTPQPPMSAPEMSITTEEVRTKGIPLGNADDKGQVVYIFDKTESYVLAAIKDGYAPDFARINIRPKIIVPQKPEVVHHPNLSHHLK